LIRGVYPSPFSLIFFGFIWHSRTAGLFLLHNDDNEIRSNCARSFGDFENQYVIAEPDVTVIYHQTSDGLDNLVDGVSSRQNVPYKIITGSDGFFNCYTNDEFEQLCLLSPDEIIVHGIEQVDKTFGKKYADNTTIVVLNS
jgi:serine/threonine protein phosphatase PrpC